MSLRSDVIVRDERRSFCMSFTFCYCLFFFFVVSDTRTIKDLFYALLSMSRIRVKTQWSPVSVLELKPRIQWI